MMVQGLIQKVITRGGEYGLTLLLILLLNFLLPRMIPGDPLISLISGADADAPIAIDDTMRQQLASYYQLDQPLPIQFLNYLWDLLHGHLGVSITFNIPVVSLIGNRLPWTLLLLGAAIVIAVPIGVLLGNRAAAERGRRLDTGFLSAMMVIKAIPSFFLGALLIYLFAFLLDLTPSSGALTPYATYAGMGAYLIDLLAHLALPLCCMVLLEMPGAFLLTRNLAVQELAQPYVLMAQARGLSDRAVRSHILTNCLAPIVTQTAGRLGFLIGGAVFIETVFAYPGMGLLIYQSFLGRDYPVLQGALFALACCVLAANFLGDLFCVWIDRRTEVN
jgi:peptide/nickel transport system permease protein